MLIDPPDPFDDEPDDPDDPPPPPRLGDLSNITGNVDDVLVFVILSKAAKRMSG